MLNYRERVSEIKDDLILEIVDLIEKFGKDNVLPLDNLINNTVGNVSIISMELEDSKSFHVFVDVIMDGKKKKIDCADINIENLWRVYAVALENIIKMTYNIEDDFDEFDDDKLSELFSSLKDVTFDVFDNKSLLNVHTAPALFQTINDNSDDVDDLEDDVYEEEPEHDHMIMTLGVDTETEEVDGEELTDLYIRVKIKGMYSIRIPIYCIDFYILMVVYDAFKQNGN